VVVEVLARGGSEAIDAVRAPSRREREREDDISSLLYRRRRLIDSMVSRWIDDEEEADGGDRGWGVGIRIKEKPRDRWRLQTMYIQGEPESARAGEYSNDTRASMAGSWAAPIDGGAMA